MNIREYIRETNEDVEKMVGSGKYGFGVIAAGLAVIGDDYPKLAGGLALVIGGLSIVAYGLLSRFMRAMGMG